MKKLLLAVVLMFSSGAVAQGHDGLPTLRSFEIAPGSLLDLDAGVVLRERKVGALQADMQFGRDGIGFYLEPLLGGMNARPGDDAPGQQDWSKDRIRVGRRGDERLTAFVKTSHGVARVSLAIVNPYSVASASVQWVVVPPTDPLFLAAPTDLRASWQGEQGARSLKVSWSGGQPRYMVEVRSGENLRKELVASGSIVLGGLDPEGVHRITVRGLEDGAISLPGLVTQHGPRKPAQRSVLDYADRWYDTTGGISLSRGATATDDAEVVCYLYGVYVPGGGVQKVGKGRATFEGLSELPTDGYLPSYGRLDESDVYAIRLPDGRYGMVWLQANDGGDLRSGMRAHTVFLPDGRRDLIAAPVASSTTKNRVVTLQWRKVPGASSYRVTVPGRPAMRTDKTSMSLAGLPADRVHEVAVVAVSRNGDESPEGTATVHTYGFDVRIGRFTLPAQRGGFEFATEQLDARNAKGLQLTGGAGSGQGLRFEMVGVIAPMGGRKYGDLSGLKVPAKGSSDWYSDHDKPESEQFLVFPRAGGCAMVRIVQRGFPSTLEYLWVPGMLAEPVMTWTTVDRVPMVKWAEVADAVSYRVTVLGQPIAQTKQTSVSLVGKLPEGVHEIAVVAVLDDGSQSPVGTAKLVVHGAEVGIGRFQLQMQRGGFEFATQQLHANEAKGLQLTGGAGSGEGLAFKAAGRIVAMGDRKYGDLSGLKAPAEGSSDWYSDHRKPESEQFLVFPKTGGCAMVRIVQRGFPSTLEYLWLPELPELK